MLKPMIANDVVVLMLKMLGKHGDKENFLLKVWLIG